MKDTSPGPFASSEQELTWRRRLRATAARIARFAYRQDQRALIDDLEMSGWVVLLTKASDRIMFDIENAMRNELSRWLNGVNRGQRPRYLTTQVPFDETTPLKNGITPEAEVMAQRAAAAIAAWAIPPQRRSRERRVEAPKRARLLGCLLESSGVSNRSAMERWGVDSNGLTWARAEIRAVLREHL